MNPRAARNVQGDETLQKSTPSGMDAMRNFSFFGICASAVLYAAIGVIGVCFLSTQPSMQSVTDGYGVFRVAIQSEHR
jgi:putative copper export protein